MKKEKYFVKYFCVCYYFGFAGFYLLDGIDTKYEYLWFPVPNALIGFIY